MMNGTKISNQNTHLHSVSVFPKIVTFWDYVEEYGTDRPAVDENIIQSMRIVCWKTKATSTDPDFVVRIVFPQQQWLHEYALILRGITLYLHCLSCSFARRFSRHSSEHSINSWNLFMCKI